MSKKILKNVLVLCVVVIFILGVICLINNSGSSMGRMGDMEHYEGAHMEGAHMDGAPVDQQFDEEDEEGSVKEEVSEMYENSEPGCVPKEQLSPEELLPQSNSSEWAKVNPQGTGTLKDKNFLQAGYHVGINTVGQTLRNANMQLRSDPPNPQMAVSPWLQSTISPDMNRKAMEIGGCE
jgi:hypothetical protein